MPLGQIMLLVTFGNPNNFRTDAKTEQRRLRKLARPRLVDGGFAGGEVFMV